MVSKGQYRIELCERLIFDTPGGGGIGPPEDRAIDDIERDLAEGLISEDAAHDIYGNMP